ncbi:MAG: gamma-glutamyl-gamma-aminobutyrate hydrolase family protein [Eubacteriales bacterium]|nr:gamma-glutamyl-gamma-aminobutyrate hydrolase family protein [Eubacteriales bacterium]
MSKTVIGVSGSWLVDKGGLFPGYKRAYVNDDYIRSLTEADALPLVLPFIPEAARNGQVEQWLEMVDGLILSGGHDLYPPYYGQEAQAKLSEVWPERDLFDQELLAQAQAMGKPVLGICRGFQLINAVRGGKILQDLSYSDTPLLKHWQNQSPDMPIHSVEFVEGTSFYELFGAETMVNSHHHQVVLEVGEGLTVAGRAPDGVIEAVEDPANKILGVQWHPEMMSISSEIMRKFFKHFVSTCA